MKIVFNIEVGIDVPSYVQAGEILDRVTREVEAAIGPKGRYDVGSFQARHRNVHDEMPMMAAQSGREFDPDRD